jgi:DNA adenine methylase
VNSKGLFNVPYGRHEKISLPSREHLRQVSRTLRSKRILTGSFEKTLKDAQKGDFIYLDPPYPPLNGTSCFNHYTPARFTETDQENLAETFKRLDRKGCLLMISNGNSEKILELYKGFNIQTLKVTRFITCKKIRDKIKELVITNYEMERDDGQ